jgi:hypothetical protein
LICSITVCSRSARISSRSALSRVSGIRWYQPNEALVEATASVSSIRVVARAEIGAYVSASTTYSIVVLEDREADAPMRAGGQDAHAPPVADALALVAQLARRQHLLDVADQAGRPPEPVKPGETRRVGF